MADKAGREINAKNVKAWIDNTVDILWCVSVRSAKQVGRELRSSQLMVRNGEASQARMKGG